MPSRSAGRIIGAEHSRTDQTSGFLPKSLRTRTPIMAKKKFTVDMRIYFGDI